MKTKNILIIAIGFMMVFASCTKEYKTNVSIKTELDTVSYMLGVDIGNSLNASNFEGLNYDAFMSGLVSSLEEKKLKVDENEIKPYIQKYFTELRTKSIQKNLEEGQAFLEKNKENEGIIVTESGLQYEIIEEGTGVSPIATDTVVCNYRGTLIDGTEFDSSYEREEPAKFVLNKVIPGWTEGLQLMKEGAKYKFYIPTELGYGQRVRPGGKIEPNMALIFEVELIEVIPSDKEQN